MLLAVKNIMRSGWWGPKRGAAAPGKSQLARLGAGGTVGFGLMPQALLSGRRLKITAVDTYVFGADKFLSYRLAAHKDTVLSLIIAEGENGYYLAISRQLSRSEQLKLFGAEPLEMIVEEPVMKQLHTLERPEALKGWVASSYRKSIEGLEGLVLPGDYRTLPLQPQPKARHFSYFLLVSEQNDHAIEIERAADGSQRIYATVYRPASDLGQIVPAPAPVKPAVVAAAPVAARAAPVKPNGHAPAGGAKASAAGVAAVAVLERPATATNSPAPIVVNGSAAPKARVVAAPATVQEEQVLLACDVRIAGKIIDEAVRNNMTLSALIRRVVDLPVQVREKVYLPLDLSDEDYEALSERYRIAPGERQSIRQRVLRELAQFAGEEM